MLAHRQTHKGTESSEVADYVGEVELVLEDLRASGSGSVVVTDATADELEDWRVEGFDVGLPGVEVKRFD